MPKVKIARKNISLDMTAMCDMAFLLLTFFMLTSKFKPEEPISPVIPSSVSEKQLEELDLMTIQVDKDGRVFFGVDNGITRRNMLTAIGQKYKISFTEQEAQTFAGLSTFGVPVADLKKVLNMGQAQRSKPSAQPGVPADTVKNELIDWVLFARRGNVHATPDSKGEAILVPLRIAVRADQDANYTVVKDVIATLQGQNINKFNLITSLEKAEE